MRKGKWVCTDGSTQQYGRKITDKIYEFKEGDKQRVINLDNYTSEKKKEAYEPYGFPIGSLTNWIIAECIFELDM